MLRKDPPSCVILDDNMPGLSGLEVLRAIRADTGLRATPVIMYSAADQSDRVTEAKGLGAEWVVKGTPFDKLIRLIGEICNR